VPAMATTPSISPNTAAIPSRCAFMILSLGFTNVEFTGYRTDTIDFN
jgi:hypothetical protein